MAEVSEVHVRVGGWCDTCGGLGRADVRHEDHQSWRLWHAHTVVSDLRQSATIMDPESAAQYRRLADDIERVLGPAGQTSMAALTEPERAYLAMHARYESERQDDFRYWNPDPVERARLRIRWREIADALHPEGTGS